MMELKDATARSQLGAVLQRTHLRRTMKLIVQTTDLRGRYAAQVSFRGKVIDQDTGEQVGFVEETRSPTRRRISLFGGKYHGVFAKPEECAAFAKGVEAVLNRMAELPDFAESQVA
jgi:hypothetical protein